MLTSHTNENKKTIRYWLMYPHLSVAFRNISARKKVLMCQAKTYCLVFDFDIDCKLKQHRKNLRKLNASKSPCRCIYSATSNNASISDLNNTTPLMNCLFPSIEMEQNSFDFHNQNSTCHVQIAFNKVGVCCTTLFFLLCIFCSKGTGCYCL